MDLLIGKVMTQFVDAFALEKQLKLPAFESPIIVGSGMEESQNELDKIKYIDSKT